MTKLIELDFDPQPRALRQLGAAALAVFGALAVAAFHERWLFAFGLGAARLPVAASCAALGLLSGLFALVYPRGNRPLYVALSLLGYPIGVLLSQLVLGLLFFAVITPIGLLLRALGHDALGRRFDRERPSYWRRCHPPRDKASYFRQY